MTLSVLVCLTPQILIASQIEANVDLLVFIGCILYSLFFLIDDFIEASAGFLGLALSFNQQAVWVMPIFIIVYLAKQMRESFEGPDSADADPFNFKALHGFFSKVSSAFMMLIMTTLLPYLPIFNNEEGFKLVETIASRIFLENYQNKVN